MPTPLVDHGSNTATRTAMRSTFSMRANGSCRAEAMTDNIEPIEFISLRCVIHPHHAPRPFRARVALPGRERHAAGNADAEHVHPSFVEIEDVRVEQRGEDILHDDQQSDPGDEPSPRNSSRCTSHIAYSTTIPTMPHCTATFKGLVVRIADDLSRGVLSRPSVAARSNSPRVEPVRGR